MSNPHHGTVKTEDRRLRMEFLMRVKSSRSPVQMWRGTRAVQGAELLPQTAPQVMQSTRFPASSGTPGRDRVDRLQQGAIALIEARDAVAHPSGCGESPGEKRVFLPKPPGFSHGEAQ